MGLDMYAYKIKAELCSDESVDPVLTKPDKTPYDPEEDWISEFATKIASWRKVHGLNQYFHELYEKYGGTGEFNSGDFLQLKLHDIQKMQLDLAAGLIDTQVGYWEEEDQAITQTFFDEAKKAIQEGYKIIYYCSW